VRRKAHLLIVEDDGGIGANLQRALTSNEVDTAWAHTIAEATALTEACPPDVVLLDLGLPDGDGIDLCRMLLTARPALPILILTARDAEIDAVVGLDAGAVDYVTKPFRLAELSARIRTHLRRVVASGDRIVVGELVVDRAARNAFVAGVEVDLRAKEFDLLSRLAEVAGSVLRREALMADLWDAHWFGSTKTLDVTVSTLRRKLDVAAPGTVTITTLRGVGYRLEPT
jgi:DNA-binding response OmpR family regulator